ncbi:MAG: hypothetical protein M1392_05650 [Gammaproteobacteria bacterium]|nr:hypothetical protein [Gammaproteobacteria bacterium]
MQIEIETRDIRVAFDILGPPGRLTSGTSVLVPGGATLTFEGLIERRALDVPGVLQFIVDSSIDIEIGLLGAWFYEKVKGRATRLRINRVEIQIEEGEITRVLSEQIEHKR